MKTGEDPFKYADIYRLRSLFSSLQEMMDAALSLNWHQHVGDQGSQPSCSAVTCIGYFTVTPEGCR